jgi:hypothetical protein
MVILEDLHRVKNLTLNQWEGDLVDQLHEPLQVAIQTLAYLPSIQLIGPWTKKGEFWVAPLTVQLQNESQYIPKETQWYLMVSSNYPRGTIHFWPSKTTGITATFQHQAFNGLGERSQPYREGAPCITFPNSTLGKLSKQREPDGAYERLAWYGERLLEWLEAAI